MEQILQTSREIMNMTGLDEDTLLLKQDLINPMISEITYRFINEKISINDKPLFEILQQLSAKSHTLSELIDKLKTNPETETNTGAQSLNEKLHIKEDRKYPMPSEYIMKCDINYHNTF